LDNYKVWLNLRNDDIFMHRWGSPDYVREFIKWMPHDHSPGFYMGSDGYVWARESIARNPKMAGRLEIDKHWYRFRLWGQLAYNPELGRDYWQAVLKHRFGAVDARLLYDAWASTSEIIPQLNRSSWSPTDAAFSAEGCMERSGFLTVDAYYFDREPMVLTRIDNAPDPQCISVTEWAKAFLAGKKLKGTTPLQVADNLDKYAATALAALPALRKNVGNNVELKETLNDIESMAYLGRHYADKIRGAAKLAVFREGDRQDKQFHDQAVAHLKDAVDEWKAYAAILSSQYKTSLLARTHFLDWNSTLKEVEKEVITVQQEGDLPEVRFADLADGARVPAETELRVEVDATDGDGIAEVKLYLNGLLLDADRKPSDPYVWSGSSDEFLKALKPGMYHLEVVAEDRTGVRSQQEIQIFVGNVSQNSAADRRDEIYQVILNEDERLMDGDVREFPRLECFLTLEGDGRLALFRGTPREREGLIWKTRGKADRPTPQPTPPCFYTILEGGQLVVYRGMPDNPDVILWQSNKPSDKGPYKLGITASRRLIIFSKVGEKLKVIWRSPLQN
ncbi:MAG: Ig-like domain-containing protein, partial [Planctomycetota bacterium]